MAKTMGRREVEQGDFEVVSETEAWFEVIEPAGGEEMLLLRQNRDMWHSFHHYRAAGSGGDPFDALHGKLGNVIGSDSQLRTFCQMVLSAPKRLSTEYAGLRAVQRQCAKLEASM